MTSRLEIQGVRSAALWMTGSLFAYVAVAVSAREVSAELDTASLLFFRAILSLLVVLTCLPFTPGRFQQLRTKRLGLHVARNLALIAASAGWFYAIATIPLAEVFIFEFTTPFWIALLAPLLIKERLTRARLVSIAIGFVGVLVIVDPSGFTISAGVAAILGAAVGFALTAIATRGLSSTESPVCILTYTYIIQMAIFAIFVVWAGTLVIPSSNIWFALAVLVGSNLIAYYCQIKAFSRADAIVVAPMDYMRLPLIALVGAQFYDEPLSVTLVFGAFFILLGNMINITNNYPWRWLRLKKRI